MSGPYETDSIPGTAGYGAAPDHPVPSSEALVEDAAAVLREQGSAFGRNLVEQVRANPVPVLLTGIGVSWLLANSLRASRERSLVAYAGGVDPGEPGGYRDDRPALREGYDRLRNDQPLVLGAVAIAAGALIGSLLPESDVEASYLGSYSDEAKSRVRREVEQASILVKEAAVRATDGARQALDPASDRARSEATPRPPGPA